MKFLTNSNYYTEVKNCFDNDESLDIAVAFWGIDAIPLFTKNKEIRIVCNLESTACNPKVIEIVRKYKNVKIKSNKQLHAKVLIQKSRLISGSANISINGLAMQGDEIHGWVESGIKTKNRKMISESSVWFDNLWESSHNISLLDIRKYKKIWKNRRKNRPMLIKKKTSLLEAATSDISLFNDRNIYFVIYRNDNLSSDASEIFEEVKKEYTPLSEEISCYEGCLELPDNADIISLYYGPRGGGYIDGNGIYEMPSTPLVEKFIYKEDDSEGSIKLCFIKNKLYGYSLTGNDKKIIKNRIKALWKYGQQLPEDELCIIPFVEGMKIINS
jgi:hypothetical protein